MKRLIVKGITVALLVAALAFLAATPAFADTNPSGTGQPGQTCLTDPTGFTEPGNASSSPGSPFNETLPGIGGQNYAGNGSGSSNANSTNAVSQYDVACYQLSH